ncbi:MAG: TetR/AcrR family transcriptional regulator [Acidimicrobiia bacterium]
MGSEPPRERIVREATRLFSDKGFERTTIPDIQAASGLSPGAGGMYRHFPSKEALLEEVVHRLVSSFEERAEKLAAEPSRDYPEDFLELLAKGALDEFAEGRDGVRIALRSLDHFPHLQREFREKRIQSANRALAAWLESQVKAGRLRDHDSKAMAPVILGSLVSFRILEALTGERPVPVADKRFLAAWLDLVLTGLAPTKRTSKAPLLRNAKPVVRAKGEAR